MRRQYLVFACIAAAAMTGCGGSDPPRAQKPPTPVALKISSPTDLATVRDETVVVKGTVDLATLGKAILKMAGPSDPMVPPGQAPGRDLCGPTAS